MTPCIEWQGRLHTNGYGLLRGGGFVHRHVMEQAGHDISGKVVRHRCDNPRCYRLDHLELGTQTDNIRDMHERGRASAPPVRRGEENLRSKLTEEQVVEIRWRHPASSLRQLADEFGVSKKAVLNVVHRRTWRHVA